jgi:hypothetical protein
VSKKNRPSTELRTKGGDELEIEEVIEKIMDHQVFTGEIVLYFNVDHAEEPWKAERWLVDNFKDATVHMTKHAAPDQVILTIRGKSW